MLIALIIITTLTLIGVSLGIFFLYRNLQQQILEIEALKKELQEANKNIVKLGNFIRDTTTQQTEIINKKIETLTKIEELK